MAAPLSVRIIGASFVVVLVAATAWTALRHESDGSTQSTDDAYVQADFTVVAPQIAGRVSAVMVEDNQAVKKGEVLVAIDDRDMAAAVESAKAQVASEQAAIESLLAQIRRQESSVRQATATMNGDAAALTLAAANRDRFRNLANDGSGTVQALQQAEAQWRIQQATSDRNAAALLSVRQQTEVLQAELQKARAGLARSQAGLETAQLNLSYTRIAAPAAGVVSQRSVRVGAFVPIGRPLLTIVPLDAVYVEANFRETQLAHVRRGQEVRMTVDALPGAVFRGHVESLGPASGVSFSAIAPHNATGNFTKIVQRLPVRIRFDEGVAAAQRLRVGMSVQASIEVAH